MLALLAAAALVSAVDAKAEPAGVKVGVLNCAVGPGWGLVVGSQRDFDCAFKTDTQTETYTGRITNLGVDIGRHDSGQLVWAVFAPAIVQPGALAGHYGGITGGGTLGVGAEANVLVGGSRQSVSLQPVSLEGENGVALAGGVSGITLRSR
jgi:hypothetical protein